MSQNYTYFVRSTKNVIYFWVCHRILVFRVCAMRWKRGKVTGLTYCAKKVLIEAHDQNWDQILRAGASNCVQEN